MPQPEHSCLQPQDLILYEEDIRSNLARFVSFQRGVVTLSPNGTQNSSSSGQWTPRFDPQSKTLTVPLPFGDQLLGYFTAENIDLPRPQAMAPLIEASVELILKNIALEKHKRRDELTGLMNKTAFRSVLEQEIEHALLSLHPEYAAPSELPLTTHRAGFGVILIGVDRMTWFNRAFGHLQGDELLKQTAARLQDLCPPEAVLGRLDGDLLSVLFPAATAAKCQTLSDTILSELASFEHTIPVTRDGFQPGFSLGWATFPKDMVGEQLRATAAEQACHVIEKCIMALGRAKIFGGGQAFSFSDILTRGAQIVKRISQDRVTINIGSLVNARSNQHFSVVPCPDEPEMSPQVQEHPAEVRIIETGSEHSLAEIVRTGPFHPPVQSGCRLKLLPAAFDSQSIPPSVQVHDLVQGIVAHPEFLNRINAIPEPDQGLAVILCQDESLSLTESGSHPFLSELADLFLELCSPQCPAPPLFGEFGPRTLSILVPRIAQHEAEAMSLKLGRAWEERFKNFLCVGISCYPCLDHHLSDMWDNAQKALNHARLLSRDRVAVYDSLTLTISADEAFSRGDLGAALEEYRRALLLDEANTLARNSLGICYARTGKLNRALREFQRVIDIDPDNRRALYNVGVVAMKIGDLDLAGKSLEKCLNIDPSQIFCLIRLGQVAARKSDLQAARQHFQAACDMPGGKGLGHRHLGELCLKQDQREQAKTSFQRALVHNPRDAEALHHLAEIYLTEGQDLDMAENMARLSLNLRPGHWRSIHLLEKILLAADRKEEAQALRAWNSGLGRDGG